MSQETLSNADQLRAAKAGSAPEVPAALAAVEAETKRARSTKQAVKDLAARRQAQKDEASPPKLAPVIPDPDDPAAIDATISAEEEYARQIEQAPKLAAELRTKLDDLYLVYVRCRQTHAPQHPAHGIYLKGHPETDTVKWSEWRSRQKKMDERYYPADVMCQACAIENRAMPLEAVEKVSAEGDIRINPRHLFRRAKDPKRAAVEGEHRVWNLGRDSVNGGRRDALLRAKAAGYEVLDL